MGILRTVEWKLTCPPAEADARFRQAFARLNLNPEGPPGTIRGSAKRAIMKNRWAAEVSVDLSPSEGGTAAVCRVDMAGTKHFELLGEIAEAVGDDVYDDRAWQMQFNDSVRPQESSAARRYDTYETSCVRPSGSPNWVRVSMGTSRACRPDERALVLL